MPYESTTKGNPQRLTIEQHFHTAHAIAKFYGDDGKVEVKIIESNETVKRHKRASIFCAKRAWDERAERGYMASIEAAFHEEIDNVKPVSIRNHAAISRYFLLWGLRFNYHSSPIDDANLKGISGSAVSKEQQEILESKGYSFVREHGVVPSRFLSSIGITIEIDRYWPQFEDVKWGLLEATDSEFLVADSYSDLMLIPFTPKMAFAAGHVDQKIPKHEVAKINKESVLRATSFYFGRDLVQCPIAK